MKRKQVDSELSKLRNRIDYEIERCMRNCGAILEVKMITANIEHCVTIVYA